MLLLAVAVLTSFVLAPVVRGGEVSPPAATQRAEPNGVIALPGLGAADFARALLQETNRVRQAEGRRPLRPMHELDAAADDHAAYMALTSQVQHQSFLRGQETPRERARAHGVLDVPVTENVAMTTLSDSAETFSAADIAARLVAQWLDSPGHRENLLNPRHTHFGGSVRLVRLLGRWRAYGVQVFIIDDASTRKTRTGPIERIQIAR